MTVAISNRRIFSLPCLEGLRLFRRYRNKFPGLPLVDLLELIESVEADAQSLDMEASVHLSNFLEVDCPLEGPIFYRSCIEAILLKHRPMWYKTMRGGRQRFVDSLNIDDKDVFTAAGLMDNPASTEVVTWWDGISGYERFVSRSGEDGARSCS